MNSWTFASGTPPTFVIAADARLSDTDPCNDQIWEVTAGTGEPPALAAQTTFGLRARLMRLFPIFGEGAIDRFIPLEFAGPPQVVRALPNYLAYQFSPFQGIDVLAEYWVPGSQVITGRLKVTNTSVATRQLRLQLAALLTPLDTGQAMTPLQIQVASVLYGQTGDLKPVLFLTGAPETGLGTYPSLTVEMSLDPQGTRLLSWALASLPDLQASFELARRTTARPWEAEMARIEMQNQCDQVDIQTGDPEWNTAFAFSQRTALQLNLSGSPALHNPTFVSTRRPDQGYSRCGGNDYTYLWNGQSALDAYTLQDALPGASLLARGWLKNFIAVQDQDGAIDWRPGPAGQRSHLLAQPILASLAWRIYQSTQDRDFIQEVYPDLYRFLWSWFTPEHDRDGDEIPEWDHPQQTGLDETPLFDRWHEWGRGLDISTAEAPGLAAMLIHECQCLMQMATALEVTDTLPALTALSQHLSASLRGAWDAERQTYFYRDRDTHICLPQVELQHWQGSGKRLSELILEPPRRLSFRIRTQRGTAALRAAISITGKTRQASLTEEIPAHSFLWDQGQAYLTTQNVFSNIETVDISGLEPEDDVSMRSAGYEMEDISLLLPLWAKVPENAQAEGMVEKTIFAPDRYGRPYGLPVSPGSPLIESVHLPWNSLVTAGLLAYGYRRPAADLFTRWMGAILTALREDGAFHKSYQATTGQGLGERDILQGLIPLRTFLDILGVQIIPPRQVILRENNPFPWPVTVQYQGLKVIREESLTHVTFSDGQLISVGPGDHLISLE